MLVEAVVYLDTYNDIPLEEVCLLMLMVVVNGEAECREVLWDEVVKLEVLCKEMLVKEVVFG